MKKKEDKDLSKEVKKKYVQKYCLLIADKEEEIWNDIRKDNISEKMIFAFRCNFIVHYFVYYIKQIEQHTDRTIRQVRDKLVEHVDHLLEDDYK